MMRWRGFRGPKGWDEFAGEIAVVVIGVLIALGAQQLVERFTDRERADRAIAALRNEVADIDFTSSEVQIAAPCIDAQLNRIQAKLAAGDRNLLERYTGTQLSGGDFVVRAPSRVWATDVWQSVGSTDVLRGVEPKLNGVLANLYSQVAHQREGNDRVRSGVYHLNALSVLVPEGESDRFRLISQIEQIRGEASLMDLRAGQLRDGLAAANMLLSSRGLAERLAASGTIRFCREKGYSLGKLRPAVAADAD
jgi:hypothetical protein